MKYSTSQVAKKIGVHKLTLIRWLLDGKVPEPERVKQGGIDLRLWTASDVEMLQKYKAAHYCKGRGRKKDKPSKV